MWKVRIVSCVPGSPIDWAAMMPTARPRSTELAAGQVHAVAAGTDAQRRLARERATDADALVTEGLDAARDLGRDELVLAHDHLVVDDVDDRVARDAAADRLGQRHGDAVALVDDELRDAAHRPAVLGRHDDVLGDVRQLTRQVAGVGRLQRRVGQALTSAVRRREVLEHASGLRGSSP